MLGPYSHGQPAILQVSSHQTKPGTKDIFSLLIPTKMEEGLMKSVCVEEQKLMGEANSPPSWPRLETRYFNKVIYK